VHPAPRRFAYGLMALFILAIAWATLGQVDIVAVAPGRIIVSDRSKIIQPLEPSIVRRVRVKDGDRVQAGQVLVELDPTIANADKASVAEQIKAAASEQWRTQALLTMLLNKELATQYPRGPEVNLTGNLTINLSQTPARRAELAEAQAVQSHLQSEWQDIRGRPDHLAR
jgi:hemolysin D